MLSFLAFPLWFCRPLRPGDFGMQAIFGLIIVVLLFFGVSGTLSWVADRAGAQAPASASATTTTTTATATTAGGATASATASVVAPASSGTTPLSWMAVARATASEPEQTIEAIIGGATASAQAAVGFTHEASNDLVNRINLVEDRSLDGKRIGEVVITPADRADKTVNYAYQTRAALLEQLENGGVAIDPALPNKVQCGVKVTRSRDGRDRVRGYVIHLPEPTEESSDVVAFATIYEFDMDNLHAGTQAIALRSMSLIKHQVAAQENPNMPLRELPIRGFKFANVTDPFEAAFASTAAFMGILDLGGSYDPNGLTFTGVRQLTTRWARSNEPTGIYGRLEVAPWEAIESSTITFGPPYGDGRSVCGGYGSCHDEMAKQIARHFIPKEEGSASTSQASGTTSVANVVPTPQP